MVRIDCIRIQTIAGHIFGMVQPAMLAELDCTELPNNGGLIRRLASALKTHLSSARGEELAELANSDRWDALPLAIGAAVAGLQEAAGIPVPSRAKLLAKPRNGHGVPLHGTTALKLLMPSFEARSAKSPLRWLLRVVTDLAADPAAACLSPQRLKELRIVLEELRPLAPMGSNNIRFIRAAYALGIPVMRLTGNVVQYGWGKRSRWFQSSISDETSCIGVNLAKNKWLTNALLRIGGLPVPEGRLVRSADEAAALAEKYGYPVVVKPADQDQGIGVSADLQNGREVREAYEQARKISPNIMLERHVPGTAFRINVFRGKTASTVQRRPAGIVGDGVATIAALIETTNQDSRRSTSPFSLMKPILIDDEAEMLLSRIGMSLQSVPPPGQFIALRRAANVSTGGDVVVLENGSFHPSYRQLAERAAELLRLDIAAVDFITQDIRQAWSDAGAAVIEVNAQPQMGSVLTQLHGQLLKAYVPGNGSLPSVVVMGSDRGAVVSEIRAMSAAALPALGSVTADSICIGAQKIAAGRGEGVAAVRTLLVDTAVSALLLTADPLKLSSEGLPLPFCDHLVLGNLPGPWPTWAMALALTRDHIRKEVWLEQGHPLFEHIGMLFSPEKIRRFASRQVLLAAIIRELNEDNHD